MEIDPVVLLRKMVEIPSLSGQEGDLARFLVKAMERLGFESRIDQAGNAVGVRGARDETALEVVLLGHMDTVPGDIPVRIEDDVLFGRGTVDAKGPLAAFIVAASGLELPDKARLVVIGAVEEESSTSRGARAVRDSFDPDACVIGEPSGWNGVTVGYKGHLLVEAELERAIGQCAGPETGAAEKMAAWWQGIKDYSERFNAGCDGLFRQLIPSLRSINTRGDGLSEYAWAEVGFRLPPGIEEADLEWTVSKIDPGIEVRFRGYEPAFAADPRSPLARAFTGAIREMGDRPRIKYKTGTSDMNVVGPAWRCPIIAYGPGDSRLDHTPGERISVAEFRRSISILSAGLKDYLGRCHYGVERRLNDDPGDRGQGVCPDGITK
jgi:LysW-gamma-L-lysine carboxypeptidase